MVEPGTTVLEWDDVQPAAERGFSIWSGGSDLQWAKRAWGALVRAGLASYHGELDRCRIAVRFLALVGIYSDFCLAAFDEDAPPDYADLAAELDVSPFRVGQLAGEDDAWDEPDDEGTLVEDVLRSLADAARPEIVPTLRDAFGGVSGLFVALWRTASDDDSGEAPGADREEDGGDADRADDPDVVRETDEEILNDTTPEKLAALAWLEEGCDPYR